MPKCGHCYGEGRQYWDEDGRRVEDVCYHCRGTGYIDDRLAWVDRVADAALREADRQIGREMKEADEAGDEYYHERAAEEMMRLQDLRDWLVIDRQATLLSEWEEKYGYSEEPGGDLLALVENIEQGGNG